ncbi:Cell cycle associated protein 1 [Cichlidogyrus casuarinus]|uniref:Cell cycle associated protein 1 n=1 Tax=Cichlidogyrus casuarinus TaxID=1844966 RepID=A0ABD2PKG5_9PLAT
MTLFLCNPTEDVSDAEVKRLKERLGQFRQVAFYAGLMNSSSIQRNRNVKEPTRLVMDTVITNVGGGYRPAEGVFVAPFAGLYAFVLTVSASQNEGGNHALVVVNMTKNGVNVMHPWALGKPWATSSMQCILDLQIDDLIELNIRPDSRIPFGEMCTTFSGFLMH